MNIGIEANRIYESFREKYNSGASLELIREELARLEEIALSMDRPTTLAVAKIYFDRSMVDIHDFDRGIVFIYPLMEIEDPDALYVLGDNLLLYGKNERFKAQGEMMLRKSAEAGNTDAQISLALHLLDDGFVKHNAQEGVEWLTRAAKANDAEAQFLLACEYDRGDETPHDKEAALFWAKQAEKNGNADAILLVAVLEDS